MKRGQAAVEFLMTYGWAIVLLAIVIGIIGAMGLFNSGKYAMDSCFLGPSFSCHSELTKQSNVLTLYINMSNNLPYRIYLSNASFKEIDTQKTFSLNIDRPLNRSDSILLTVPVPNDALKGAADLGHFDIQLAYYVCAKNLNPDCKKIDEAKAIASGRITAHVVSNK